MKSGDMFSFGSWIHEPLEKLSAEVLPFWAALRQHEFRLCRCSRCGAHFWPFTVCPHHDDIPDLDEMHWAPTSGKGQIFASLVVERVVNPAYQGEVPYVLALVELDEGPLFPTRIATTTPYDIKIGMRVRAYFLDVDDPGQTFPLFELDGGKGMARGDSHGSDE